MPLNTVTTGNTVLAGDINQLVNVLQRASGQTEAGKYWLEGNAYTTGAYITCFIPSLSRVSTPVSVSIDTADQAPAGSMTGGTPGTFNLTASGFHISQNSTAATTNMYCGGNYTIQF